MKIAECSTVGLTEIRLIDALNWKLLVDFAYPNELINYVEVGASFFGPKQAILALQNAGYSESGIHSGIVYAVVPGKAPVSLVIAENIARNVFGILVPKVRDVRSLNS